LIRYRLAADELADLMPYGGLKNCGLGKEGPRYAVEEMTDLKRVGFHLRD
jgi:acyl-CoA reductase-like NAD-dependent aldehyde dehydrogenase